MQLGLGHETMVYTVCLYLLLRSCLGLVNETLVYTGCLSIFLNETLAYAGCTPILFYSYIELG